MSSKEVQVQMGSADTNDTNIKGQVLNGEEHIQMQSADPFKTNGEDEQKHHQKETTSEATELEENQQRDQTIGRYKEEEEEDQVEELLKEWNSVEKFRLKTFFISLFFASLSFFDFFSDGLLGVKFLQEGLVFDSSKTDGTFINDNCTALDIKIYNYSDYIESRQYNAGSYTCENYNRMYGFATLAILFLPGIQWHAYLKTKYHLGKFLTSLFFPFFMVIFQVFNKLGDVRDFRT